MSSNMNNILGGKGANTKASLAYCDDYQKYHDVRY